MAKPSMVIIGAGIAGLSAGVYGQMNGYSVKIFEMHSLPGGLCTSWKRKGYLFDGCIHWLCGSKPGSALNRLWNEVGALDGQPIVDHDEFLRVVGKDGKTLIVYTNVDRFERHLLELSPADAGLIKELAGAIRKASVEIPGDMPEGVLEMLKLLPSLPSLLSLGAVIKKYSKVTMKEFTGRFKDPFLRWALGRVLGYEGMPASAVISTLGTMNAGDAGYPVGGSLLFATNIEKRLRRLGGEVEYNARVEQILVENGRAVGIRLADGREVRADVVISAADGQTTIFKMLDGRYCDDRLRSFYANQPIFESIIQVSLGINRDISQEPHQTIYELDEPLTLAGENISELNFKHYGYDPQLAPQGKSIVEAIFSASYDYWKTLADDRERYEAEKQQVAIRVIEQLEKRYPGITPQIEVVDVATPLTFERYTGNWRGSFEGWMITRKTMEMTVKGEAVSRTLPGLENFYMVGQWAEAMGGLPPAVMSGRSAVKAICKKGGRPFKTSP